MRTSLRTALLALLTIVALVASTEEAVAANTRHSGPNWVWFGPSTWHASYGTYGITVASPSNQDVLDLGFSSTVCSPGATYNASVANHFAALRKQYGTAPFKLVSASAIGHPAGSDPLYRRQNLRVTFKNNNVAYTGDFSFDYDYQTTVSTGFSTVNYCYQRSLAIYAPTTRYATSSRNTLTAIFHSLAYSGPGACLGTNGSCDPDL